MDDKNLVATIEYFFILIIVYLAISDSLIIRKIRAFEDRLNEVQTLDELEDADEIVSPWETEPLSQTREKSEPVNDDSEGDEFMADVQPWDTEPLVVDHREPSPTSRTPTL